MRPDYVGLQRCFVFTLPTVKLLGTMGLAEGTREDSSIFYSKEARGEPKQRFKRHPGPPGGLPKKTSKITGRR